MQQRGVTELEECDFKVYARCPQLRLRTATRCAPPILCTAVTPLVEHLQLQPVSFYDFRTEVVHQPPGHSAKDLRLEGFAALANFIIAEQPLRGTRRRLGLLRTTACC